MPAVPPLTFEPLVIRRPQIDGLLCVDLEDWFQISLRARGLPPRTCREQFRRGVTSLLKVLERHEARATFFVLGMTVAGDTGIVRELIGAGHEVATHGYEHVHLERRTLEEFGEDLRRAIGELSALTGEAVRGHRAPEFSVPRKNASVFLGVVRRCGLLYDSSVYPISGKRYGLSWFPPVPCRVAVGGDSLIELPISTVRWMGRRWPIGGGGSWRIVPRPILRYATRLARRQGVLLTTYMHNYEFDPEHLDLAEVVQARAGRGPTWHAAWRSNLFRRSMKDKLADLLARFSLTTCWEYIVQQAWLNAAAEDPIRCPRQTT